MLGYQEADALTGPNIVLFPNVDQNGQQSVDLIGLLNLVPHEGSIWIAEPGVTVSFGTPNQSGGMSTFSIPCNINFGGPATARVWQMTDTGVGGDPPAVWKITVVGDTMNFKISPASGGAGGAGGGGSPTVGAPTMLGSGAYAWKLIRGTGSPATGLAATASVHALVASGWTVILCGNDAVGTLFFDQNFGNTFPYQVIQSEVIGGKVIPIDTTALLLAGVQSISMWMIPVLLAGIGIGLFVVSRKSE